MHQKLHRAAGRKKWHDFVNSFKYISFVVFEVFLSYIDEVFSSLWVIEQVIEVINSEGNDLLSRI